MTPIDAQETGAQGRLLTLVFTDLVDSVGLKTRLGDSEAGRLITEHQTALRGIAAAADGREILVAGDGFFLTFEIPSRAVEFALHLHDFHRQNPGLPQVRIGIHMGEVTEKVQTTAAGRTVQVDGLAVDIAFRIQALARPRQILMSYPIFDNARQRLDPSNFTLPVEWVAHGRYVFQGADMALAIYEVGLKGLSSFAPPTDGDKAQRDVQGEEENTLGWRPAQGQDLPGRPNWVLIEKLGEGGFGDVWLTEHRKTRDRHVIKFCYSADRLRTLKREVTLFRLIRETLGDRPDIARVLDYQFDSKPYFLEMEFAGRHNLTSWLEEQGGIQAIPLAIRIELVAQVAEAISAAHSVGVLHKDIKPSNIMVTESGSATPRIRMIDFGIGAVSDKNLLEVQGITATGLTEVESPNDYASSMAGTRLYMAPELIEGKTATTKSDIYSLGVLLYQMVSGKTEHSLSFGWERDVHDELLREDIEACVDGNPENRLASAEVLAQRLRNLPQRHAAREREAQDARRLINSKKRWRLAYLAAALLVVVLIMFAQFAMLQLQKAKTEETLRKKADTAALNARTQTAKTKKALEKAQQAQYFGTIALAEASLRESRFEKINEILFNEAPRNLLHREWGWLLAQTAPEDFAFKNADIFDVQFTPDGNRFITGSRDKAGKGYISVYDAHTARRIGKIKTNNRLVWNVAVSPDGRLAATASHDHRITVVDLTSPTIERVLKANKGVVRDVAFSPDGNLLASVSRDHTVRVWDTENYKMQHVFTVEADSFTELDFSPDSRYLVTGSLEGTSRVFDTSSSRQMCELAGSKQSVLSVDFLESGAGVVTACSDGTTRIYDWPPPEGSFTLQPVATIDTRDSYPTQVISSMDGKAVYIGNDNGLITKSDVKTGEQLASIRVDQPLWKMDLCHGGKRLLTAARWSLRLLDLERLEGAADITDLDGSTTVPEQALTIEVATVARTRDLTWKGDKLWQTTSGLSLVSTTQGQQFLVKSAYDIYSPDGTEHIEIDPETFHVVIKTTDETKTHHSITNDMFVDANFSPDGKQAAVLLDKKGLTVYSTENWKPIFELLKAGNYPVRVTYTHDSQKLIVCFSNGSISSYTADGKLLRELLPARGGVALSLDVDSDNRLLAAGLNVDRAIVIDLETGDQISTMSGHVRYIHDIKFAPDAERLVTLSRDGTAKMWDIKTGRELVTIFSLQDGELPLGIVFEKKGRQISVATSKRRVLTTDVFPWNLKAYPRPNGKYSLEDRVELWKRRTRFNKNLRMVDVIQNER